jgi:aryl-alcohol dehydrogenase-like predicted oxidoreductase
MLGNTGYEVSPVAYGGIVSMKDGQANSDRYVSWAIDRGINYFDVAPLYGDAQEKLGHSLRPYRKDVYLACKTFTRRAAEARRELKESMRLLQTDYFDNYQMHSLQSVDEVEDAFSKGGVMGLIAPLWEKGDLRKLGITCHDEAAALRAMELFDFDTVLFPLNWHMHIGRGFGGAVTRAAKERGMGVLAIKGLIERRWLSDEEREASPFPKSWCKPIDLEDKRLRTAALKYTLSLGADTLIPPGDFVNFAFAVENIDECLSRPLGDEDMRLLKTAYENVKEYPFF